MTRYGRSALVGGGAHFPPLLRRRCSIEESKQPTEGFIRPEAEIFDESALVPAANLITPPPNQFTHQLRRAQPFYFNSPDHKPSDGQLSKGTNVVLLVYDGGKYCRVADGRGLYVEIEYDSLQKL